MSAAVIKSVGFFFRQKFNKTGTLGRPLHHDHLIPKGRRQFDGRWLHQAPLQVERFPVQANLQGALPVPVSIHPAIPRLQAASYQEPTSVSEFFEDYVLNKFSHLQADLHSFAWENS